MNTTIQTWVFPLYLKMAHAGGSTEVKKLRENNWLHLNQLSLNETWLPMPLTTMYINNNLRMVLCIFQVNLQITWCILPHNNIYPKKLPWAPSSVTCINHISTLWQLSQQPETAKPTPKATTRGRITSPNLPR